MRALATYVMKGRMQAIVVVTVSAILSLLLPPLSYLSGGTVALVTLKLGSRQAMGVILGAAVATGILAFALFGTPAPVVVFLALLWIPVTSMAASLRSSVNLPRSLGLATVFATLLVLGFYSAVDSPSKWWQDLLGEWLATLPQDDPTSIQLFEAAIGEVSRLMTGAMAAGFLLSLSGALLLGRWWQALLYNPGGFAGEFQQLRIGRATTLLAGVLLAVGYIDGLLAAIAVELLMVVAVPFLLQGLAVAHALVVGRGAAKGWLIALYILLFLPFTMGQALTLLALSGAVDNWLDFRALLSRRATD